MQGFGGRLNKLTRKQENAIAALLSEPTLPAAADKVGVNEVTLWRWLHRSDFLEAYRSARREVVSQATAQLQRVSMVAVSTLAKIMVDPEAPASARVAAARITLDMAFRSVELEDLESRITALEESVPSQPRRFGQWR